MLEPVLISELSRLRALRPDWEALLSRSSNDEPTLHPAWLLPWWEVYAADGSRSLRCLAIYEGARLIGLAPLSARSHRYHRAIPFRRLELLASGEDEADETCSDYLGVIAETGREADVAKALASALARGVLGKWDELVAPAMNGETPFPALYAKALESEGLLVSLEQSGICPYIALPKTFDDYLAALKGNKRGQLRKALRAFEAWAGGPPTIERVTEVGQLEAAKARLVELHRERWSSDGVFGSSRFRSFHDKAMRELLAAGALDLGSMSVRGKPIVAFYNVHWNGKSYFYQAGRKLDVPDDVRVGVTMHAYLIRSAIEAGMREYDFLAGDSQYKMSLATATRPLVTLRVARPSAVETVRKATDRAKDRARILRDMLRTRQTEAKQKLAASAEANGGRPTLKGIFEAASAIARK